MKINQKNIGIVASLASCITIGLTFGALFPKLAALLVVIIGLILFGAVAASCLGWLE